MAHNFALRARKLAWSFSDEKQAENITQIRRVGTDSTLNDDDSTSISTSITRLPPSEDVETFVSALKKDGCVIIEDFADDHSLRMAHNEAKAWMRAQEGQDQVSIPLIKQSPTIRDKFFTSEVYQDLCEEFLMVETTRWKDNKPVTEACEPILSSAIMRQLQTDKLEDNIMRYDAALGVKHEQRNKYRHGADAMLGLIIPSSEAVQVRVALGSHLYGGQKPEFDKDVIVEDLERGDALIVLGSLYHYVVAQAAQTKQQADAEPPSVHSMWSCAGVYRPEEQSAMMISAAELKTYPKTVQKRLR